VPETRKDRGLDALIFDFDGVVVDSEPVHLAAFRQVLAPLGVNLTTEDYYGKYLGYDDHDCFAAVLADNGLEAGERQIAELTAAKSESVKRTFAASVQALPGAAELIEAATAGDIPVAICSGALREEIELAARSVGVLGSFACIVAAEDVSKGKPSPEGYALALDRLSQKVGRRLEAARCIAVEDSAAGIESAKAAGMKVLAVTNSYPAGKLQAADLVVDSLADVALTSLAELL